MGEYEGTLKRIKGLPIETIGGAREVAEEVAAESSVEAGGGAEEEDEADDGAEVSLAPVVRASADAFETFIESAELLGIVE